MKSTSIRLPEKSYFTLAEIAERWGCLKDLVVHYLDEGHLREAISRDAIPPFFTDFIDRQKAIAEMEKRGKRWPGIENVPPEVVKVCGLAGNTQFLYINRKDIQRGQFDCVEDLEGNSYQLVTAPSEGKREICRVRTSDIKEFVITKGERDRFERIHKIDSEALKVEAAYLNYSTPHLDILKGAISEFFEPRRTPDAKRAEVLRWIAEQQQKRGVPPSKNIAIAIFSIIKPPDHNPKKRVG